MITPDDIETLYCGSCLHSLREMDLACEPGELVGCPYGRCGLLVPIDQHERNRRIDATRSAWDLAVRDGLIR